MAKTITLATDATIGKILFYNSGAGTYTDNSTGSSKNIVPSTVAVGDIVYIAHVANTSSWPPMAFLFDIGTALAGTSWTVVWEYYHSVNGWSAVENLQDGTNAFGTTGSNYVNFNVSQHFSTVSINSLNYTWIRARFTAVSGITTGCTTNATVVKYKSAQITINGGTSGTPFTMTDIVNDSNVQTYNFASRLTDINDEKQVYWIRGIINLATNCYLTETESTMIFKPGYFKSGYVTFGAADSNLPGLGKNGCIYMPSACDNDKNIRMYNMQLLDMYGSVLSYENGILFPGVGVTTSGDMSMTGGIILGIINGSAIAGTRNLTLINVLSPNNGSISAQNSSTNKIYTINGGVYNSIYCYQNNNFLVSDATAYRMTIVWNSNFIINDCVVTTFFFAWNSATGVGPASTYVQNSITFHIQDKDKNAISGATVTAVDQYGTAATFWSGDETTGAIANVGTITSDASGDIAKQLFLYTQTTRTFVGSVSTTSTTYGPYTFTISADGYQTQYLKLEMDTKQIQTITMEPVIYQLQTGNGEIIHNNNPTNNQNKIDWVET